MLPQKTKWEDGALWVESVHAENPTFCTDVEEIHFLRAAARFINTKPLCLTTKDLPSSPLESVAELVLNKQTTPLDLLSNRFKSMASGDNEPQLLAASVCMCYKILAYFKLLVSQIACEQQDVRGFPVVPFLGGGVSQKWWVKAGNEPRSARRWNPGYRCIPIQSAAVWSHPSNSTLSV